MIPVIHTRATAEAGLALFKLVIESHGSPQPDELMNKKHNLFRAVLEAGESTEKKIGCAFEQAILAFSLLPDGRWRKASCVRSRVTAALWDLRAITANWCRLHIAGKEDYVRFSPHQTTQTIQIPEETRLPPSAESGAHGEDDSSDGDNDGLGYNDSSDSEMADDFEPCHIDEWDIQTALKKISEACETPRDSAIPYANNTLRAGPLNMKECVPVHTNILIQMLMKYQSVDNEHEVYFCTGDNDVHYHISTPGQHLFDTLQAGRAQTHVQYILSKRYFCLDQRRRPTSIPATN